MANQASNMPVFDDTKRDEGIIVSISRGANEEECPRKAIHLTTISGCEKTAAQSEMAMSILVNLLRTWGLEIYKVDENGKTVFLADELKDQLEAANMKDEGRLN